MDRRSYLKLGAGAAAASVGSATYASRVGAASETRHGISFNTVLNAVDDLGMDSNGNEAIDDALDDAAASDTLIKFPPGEYLVEESHVFLRLDNFGIVGTGGDRTDTQFVFPSGFDDRMMTVRWGVNHLLENVSLQQTDDTATGAGVVFASDDGLHIEDFEILGFNGRGAMRGMSAKIYDSDGEGVIKRYVRKGNSAVGDYPSGTQALLIDPGHEGTLYLRDLHIENAGENGVYASRTPGNVRVEGGFFKNNDVASIRICGEGDYVEDATFIVDTDAATGNEGTYDNARALWVESKTKGYSGGYAENCEFILRSADNSGGLIRIDGTAGAFDVRNCRLHNETVFATLLAKESGVSGPKKVTIENTSITTNSDAQRRGALEIEGRNGSTITDCCVATQGSGYDGIVFNDSTGNAIRRTTVDASGEPIVFNNASAQTSSISYSGSCPLPDASGGGSQDGGGDGSGDTSDGSDGSGDTSDSSDGSGDTSDGTDNTSDGTGDGARGSDQESTLHIEGTGEFASYEFSVSGAVRQDPETELAGPDTVGESSGSGAVAGGTDGYLVTGTIESFEFTEGSADVVLDGEQVDPASLGGTDTGGSSTFSGSSGDSETSSGDDSGSSSTASATSGAQSTLHVVGTGEFASYELRAESIEQDPETELAGPDTISGSSASGSVAGGTDGYLVTGLESFEFTSGSAKVYLDGTEVSPTDIGGGATTTSTDDGSSTEDDSGSASSGDSGSGEAAALHVVGTGEFASYEFSTSGTVEQDPETELAGPDTISGSSASGSVAGGTDGYLVTGTIESFEFTEGSAEVYLNDEQVDPASLGGTDVAAARGRPRTLAIGRTDGAARSYQLQVTDAVEGVDAGDAVVDGTTVSGRLDREADVIRFSGDVDGFDLDGADGARVAIDGTDVSPDAL